MFHRCYLLRAFHKNYRRGLEVPPETSTFAIMALLQDPSEVPVATSTEPVPGHELPLTPTVIESYTTELNPAHSHAEDHSSVAISKPNEEEVVGLSQCNGAVAEDLGIGVEDLRDGRGGFTKAKGDNEVGVTMATTDSGAPSIDVSLVDCERQEASSVPGILLNGGKAHGITPTR